MSRSLLVMLELLLIYLFYTNLNLMGGLCSYGVEESSQLAIGAIAFSKLETVSQTPLDVWDISSIGDRIADFSSVLQAIISDPSIDRRPFLHLLHKQFPWLGAPRPYYVPWSNLPRSNEETTGIVITVGHSDFLLAAHLISTLRNVSHSTLPIEIAYYDQSDLSSAQRTNLLLLDPTLKMVNLLDYFDKSSVDFDNGISSIRPFALLASGFQRAILVDADVIFLQKPDNLFSSHTGLVDTGALFWHDRTYYREGKFSRRDWIQKFLNGRVPSPQLSQTQFWTHDLWDQMDAGVVCMDKGRASVFMSLVLAAWMNTDWVRDGVMNAHIELSSTPYAFHLTPATIIGSLTSHLDARTHRFSSNVCSTQTLHLDSLEQPFWIHGNLRRRKSSLANRDFATLTHWVPQQLNGYKERGLEWQNQGDDFWCVEGKGIELEGTEVGNIIRKLIHEAMRIDERFGGDGNEILGVEIDEESTVETDEVEGELAKELR